MREEGTYVHGILDKIMDSSVPAKLSVIIPVFNEENTIRSILSKIEAVHLPDIEKEIIIVNDASTDTTPDILKSYEGKYKIIHRDKNGGKGAGLRDGFHAATGDYILIQDADLEYDPEDYKFLIQPLIAQEADVVYGTRFSGKNGSLSTKRLHYWANSFLTFLSNVCTGLHLTDMETCYKTFTRQALDSFKHQLISNSFSIEPEITSMISKNRLRVVEVPVSYNGRSYKEGKKIGWKDGFAAIFYIFYFNFIK